MERKLASIQKIVSLDPIPNADRIEKATVLGWECVVEKGLHKVGDLVIYVEVDSILPERPEFEFMRPRNFKVKTIRLRKQVSQGLVFPLSILPNKKWKEGDDVTELLGITKYLTPTEREEERREAIQRSRINKFLMGYKWYRRVTNIFRAKKDRGWPKFIKKTDEPRIQLFPHICKNEENTFFYASEKLNGSSATYALIRNKTWFGLKTKYEFIVCSRKIRLEKKDLTNNYWKVAEKFKIEEALKDLIEDKPFVILQGELLGPKVQGNIYGVEDVDFYVFNFIIPPYRFVSPERAKNILKCYGIKHVPILDTKYQLKDSISECIIDTDLKSKINNKVLIEGIVCRNYDKNMSFKIINPKHLLKYEE